MSLSESGSAARAPSNDRDAAIEKVGGEQAEALRWFRDRAGQSLTWREIYAHAEQGARLVNQAKGIYKPQYTDYALSVRQTLGGPYADRQVERRSDGSWRYDYFQENPDPAQRDREATNRGLVKCMEDGVPVGVLLQTKPKPGVEYEVLGLALVTDWNDGYFTLAGFAADGLGPAGDASAAGIARKRAAYLVKEDAHFDPLRATEDLREKAIAEVVRRRGQAAFRSTLIEAYGGRCAITGCNALEALEAAHIAPYRGDRTNHVQNGLLLRADIHSLFDLGLITIDPRTRTVRIAPALRATDYARLEDQPIAEPDQGAMRASRDALNAHAAWTGLMETDGALAA